MGNSFSVRAEEAADRDGIRAVVGRAFGRESEALLVDAIRASEQFIPELSIVAISDGRVIGHALFSRISIDTENGMLPALTLAPVAVVSEWQGRGVGSALVCAGLERARQLGERIVVVVGHPGYYPRFGFASARAQGLESPLPVSDPAFMALDLVAGVVDGVRGMVVYPPAFDLVE